MICRFFAITTFQKEFVIRKTYVIRDSAILFVQNIYETVGSFTKHSMSETIANIMFGITSFRGSIPFLAL